MTNCSLVKEKATRKGGFTLQFPPLSQNEVKSEVQCCRGSFESGQSMWRNGGGRAGEGQDNIIIQKFEK